MSSYIHIAKNNFFETLFFLAPVSRIVKYYHQYGMPLLTTGGMSFEFVDPKQGCEDEYFMQVRNGFFSYVSIAEFLVSLFEQ